MNAAPLNSASADTPIAPGNDKPWACAPVDAAVLPTGVQVWAAWLDVNSEAIAACWSTLSNQERVRADRFAFERDRARFVAARGQLRAILGSCLGAEPRNIEFAYSAKGKPSLAGDFARTGLQFNLSHSGGLAVFALACYGMVGVDVEQIRPVPELSALMERFFSAVECAEIKKLFGEEQLKGFFRVWIRKEAWLKATGEGITGELRSVEVLGPPGEQGSLGGPQNDFRLPPLSLYDLAPAPGFLGALALAPH